MLKIYALVSTKEYSIRVEPSQVDSTAKPEKELAKQFHRKAEELEKNCFPRFATTLKRLRDYYEAEAKRIVDEHSQRPRSD